MRRLALWTVIPCVLTGILASLSLSQPASGGRKFALLVGVKDYSRSAGELGNLQHTENDVNDLAAFLRDKAGYRRVVVLTQTLGNSDRTLAPTADNITEHLRSLLGDAKKGDTVLVAFSGHGILQEVNGKEASFFCPMDARPKQGKNLVALDEVYASLNGDNCKADVKLMLVDACRNDPNGKSADSSKFDPASPPKGVVALYSCRKGQKSYESAKAKRGFFFDVVLEGLSGKAANGAGQVTLLGLAEYVKDEVPLRVKAEVSSFVRQTPSLVAGEFSGKVVLALAAAGPRDTETLTLPGGQKMEFVRIKPGTFTMGSPKEEKGHNIDEDEHAVEIAKPFYLGKFEVTRGQFRAFVNDDGYRTEAETGDGAYGWNVEKGQWVKDKAYNWKNVGFTQTDEHPVVCVSWNDAEAFCKWLSRKTGKAVALPSEAQWEYACRAGSQKRFAFGDDEEDLAKYANVADATARADVKGLSWGIKASDGHAFTAPVGKKLPNAWGLYDLHGNVWEWCADYYGLYREGLATKDPLRIKEVEDYKDSRVLRGGSWSNLPVSCRAANRGRFDAAGRIDYVGFRVVFRLD